MKNFIYRMWRADDGVLTFEWTMLASLLTIGIVGGVASSRDAIIDELGDVSQAMVSLDQSYTIDFPLATVVHGSGIGFRSLSSASDSSFVDASLYEDCDRADRPDGQPGEQDAEPMRVDGI